MLTAERLRQLLSYEPETGVFRWLAKPNRNIRIGSFAGTLHHSGYVQIGVDGRLYLAQRLAFLWMLGRWPMDGFEAEHSDTVKTNNAWSNLREATKAQNAWNVPMKSINTSGVKGVSWRADRQKWVAEIGHRGRSIKLGLFESRELATEFRQLAAEMLHGAFVRHA